MKKVSRYQKSVNRRLKKLAKFAKGKTLDIGYIEQPNVDLKNPDGLDIMSHKEGTKRYGWKYETYDKLFAKDLNQNNWHKGMPKYDTILAGEVLEHIENPSKFMRDCHSLLKKGGRLVITTPNPISPKNAIDMFKGKNTGRKDHISMLPPVCVRRVFWNAGFDVVYEEGFGVPIPFLRRAITKSTKFSGVILYIGKKK